MPRIYTPPAHQKETIRVRVQQNTAPVPPAMPLRTANKIVPGGMLGQNTSAPVKQPVNKIITPKTPEEPRQHLRIGGKQAQQPAPFPVPATPPKPATPRIAVKHVTPVQYPKMLGRIRFRIVVPCYNASPWIAACLRSIASQTYTDFKCLVKDDASTDATYDAIKSLGLDERFSVERNNINVGPLQNCLDAFDEMGCEDDPDAVLMIVDGDDYLCRQDALEIISKCYSDDPDLLTAYGNSAYSHNPSKGYGGAYPQTVIDARAFRKSHAHIATPRTFRSRLWYAIDRRDLKDPRTGQTVRVAGDAAFIVPLMEMAGDRIKFIETVIYIYNMTNPISDFRIRPKEQQDIDNYMRSLAPYPILEAMGKERVKYHARYDEDVHLVERVFDKKRNGIFVDIGAGDGVTCSNTCTLERHFGWTGVCVEQDFEMFKKLNVSRSAECINENIGANYCLKDVFRERSIKFIDYLSIKSDENAADIIRSIDFDRVDVRCVSVCSKRVDSAVWNLLLDHGFRRNTILGRDEIYTKEAT